MVCDSIGCCATPAAGTTECGATILKRAYFGMQCFWSVESSFAKLQGVRKTRVGYAGGTTLCPNYIAMGDHTEITEIQYDERLCSYEDLLDWFFQHHDSTVKRKRQYESVILYVNEEQKTLAEDAISREQKRHGESKKVWTRLHAFDVFHQAEDYHQKYWLRCQRRVCDKLGIGDVALVDSVLAAKINAYMAGYDDGFCELKQLSAQYALSDELIAVVQSIASSGGDARACH